jgi:phosphoenolpyruvate---glycerone phosphotransferase subunit DhaL
MTQQDVEAVETVVASIARTVLDQEQAFGDLDAVVGDGDFGYSLARGFEKVQEGWAEFDRSSAPVFLQKIATVVTSRIGGTSGPIWGTAFLRAATTIRGCDAVDGTAAVEMLRAAAAGIKERGGSDVGDKTLLDALVPATDALEKAVGDGATRAEALAVLAAAARHAADATTQLQARRGRASYSGERSIGSPDAGAVAVAVICERLAVDWT